VQYDFGWFKEVMAAMGVIQLKEVKVYLPGEERDVMHMDVAWYYVDAPETVYRETLTDMTVDGTYDLEAFLTIAEGDTFTGGE